MKLFAIALASICAATLSAQTPSNAPVLNVKTAASADTLKFRVYTSPIDERKIDHESLRNLTALPGQTEIALLASDADEEPLHYYIFQETERGPRSVADVYRAPGQTIVIDLASKPSSVSGSELMDNITRARNSMTAGMEAIAKARQDKDEAAFNKAVEMTRAAAVDFIRNNPDNPGSIELMNMLTPDQIEVAELISDKAKSDLNGAMYEIYINSLKAELQRRIQAEKVAPGKPAPDFSLPDPDGKMISLSSLKGKYVMLDFWGSWCGWCIKGIPQMKEQYELLKDKVYFVSIDCNDSKDVWTAALEKYEMPWIQLWSDPSTPAPESIMTLYAVEGFPTKFIIGRDGNILHKVVGEDPAFYDLFKDLK